MEAKAAVRLEYSDRWFHVALITKSRPRWWSRSVQGLSKASRPLWATAGVLLDNTSHLLTEHPMAIHVRVESSAVVSLVSHGMTESVHVATGLGTDAVAGERGRRLLGEEPAKFPRHPPLVVRQGTDDPLPRHREIVPERTAVLTSQQVGTREPSNFGRDRIGYHGQQPGPRPIVAFPPLAFRLRSGGREVRRMIGSNELFSRT